MSGLVEYGDEVDVIGPADMLKQIFKMPYSKARLSIVVHRIGRTLVLNSGSVSGLTLFLWLLDTYSNRCCRCFAGLIWKRERS